MTAVQCSHPISAKRYSTGEALEMWGERHASSMRIGPGISGMYNLKLFELGEWSVCREHVLHDPPCSVKISEKTHPSTVSLLALHLGCSVKISEKPHPPYGARTQL